mmetsp:Transcript_11092/g.19305  ORF Transcript_11092/g.19305 Transcript_11092/m.19305 type:complete len:586 (-) Transcript_11092:432-2189(-)|eukprot:CAMPEP_0119102708 /NCGR_PEP_ID=MMETSP1180-20130426/1356_1 /TAXON_ID=3052 ORGANISM="Chlamydomonas cf sp, Strain CCMP681" /NCGR_SAMPLE_ID=MMETSP1180 /ASSEMBLY_ACC=CAM_ASM_000741 /LENGTH=585 /DNA_ID=CAMNT_0007087035 /DNA_START=115 /DNA_END=1872 /DNA_ORIENTATION=+
MAKKQDDSPADGVDKVAKLTKKVAKATKDGEADKAALLQKKLDKLLKKATAAEPVVAVEAPKANGKKRKDVPAAVVEAVVEAEQPEKKSKKAKGTIVGRVSPPDTVDLNALAEVGDASIAKSGLKVIKNLYKEHPEIKAMDDAKVAAVRAEKATVVEGLGANAFKPFLSFAHTGLPASMLHACRAFSSPSPIQAQCWPIILSGRDMIGIAATGSGKTLGFGLPMLAHITAQKDAGVVGKGKGPFAVCMAPTRELAIQINQVLEESGSQCGIRSVCIYGGVSKREQIDALRRGVEVVVGTPGRLEDLMQDNICKLHEVTYLVLDEADRMLDLGFEPHIRAIAMKVRSDRQTLMFSATWPSAVQRLAACFLSTPVRVTIGSQDLAASHTITQIVEVIDPMARNERLLQLLAQHHSNRTDRIIIFVLYKKEAPQVEGLLTRKGWKCASIHGDISQAQREAAVNGFKRGDVPLLIATDVAARGLDIPNVAVVINYSFPLTTEDYVHRIGRTGRAGKTGIAHTFFCAGMDKPRAGELINVLKEANQKVPQDLLNFGTSVKKKESKLYGAHFKDVDIMAKATKTTFDSDSD